MKKKSLLLLLLCAVLLVFSGCTKNEAKEKYKELVYEDEKTGYTTTFKFKENENYVITDDDEDGKYKQIEIENADLNVELEIYYTDHYTGGYEKQKDNRKASEGYKEYKWNNYEGYIYNADKDKVDFNIFLGNFDERDVVLFGTLDDIDSTLKTNILEVFNGESFQNFMNSIVFSN
jgi:hypothetical protein